MLISNGNDIGNLSHQEVVEQCDFYRQNTFYPTEMQS